MKLRHTLTPKRLYVMAIVLAFSLQPLAFSDSFVSSDTFVVTNSSTAVIAVTNHPQLGGANCAWYPGLIMANFRDSPTGVVLRVDHVRAGVSNPHVSTNSIAVTNTLFSTNAAGAVSSIIWDPSGNYTIVPANDSLRITTSSTNAEIILNKNAE